MHRNRRLPRWRLVMLAAMILAGLALPAPARAASLSPAHYADLNRMLKGLLIQGVRVEIAGAYVGGVGLCYQNTPDQGSNCVTAPESLRPDLKDYGSAPYITGRWRVYDAYMRRWGTMTVDRVTDGSGTYGGILTSSGGGAAKFVFFPSTNDPTYLSYNSYDFNYTTGDDGGAGFVQWTPDGCSMLGIFISSQNTDPNTGHFISSFLVFRRC